MITEKDQNSYETPQMSAVELLLEQAILQASGDPDDPTFINPGMGWDD